MGAMLSQDSQVVRFFSRKFNNSECNYTIMEKEAYAIILALKEFKNIIYGCPIKIKTDNKNLTFNKNLDTSRLQRWKLYLEEFDYEIIHINAASNKQADFLSRNFLTKNKEPGKSTQKKTSKKFRRSSMKENSK